MANVTYDPSDYSTSQIADHAPAAAVISNYKPIGQTAGGVTHYNEVPNVLTPFASGGKAGTLKPLDALRWIRTRETQQRRGTRATLEAGLATAALLNTGC